MKRRSFIQKTSVGLGAALVSPSILGSVKHQSSNQDSFPKFTVRKLTSGPKHHFFGYYGITPWNKSQTHLLCLADRTRVEEDTSSETAPVEIKGKVFGTARVPVALVDATFERVFATGPVTAHPVDPSKFEALQKMRQIRKDR